MSAKGNGRDEILAHIEQFGVARKDAEIPSARRKRGAAAQCSHTVRITLDLHGLRSEEASRRLRAAMYRCKEGGTGELLIIHGYGRHSDPSEGPVLKKMVHDMLDNDLKPLYRYYRTATLKDGGDGATLVLFR